MFRDSFIGICAPLVPSPLEGEGQGEGEHAFTSLLYFSSRHSREGGNPVLRHWIPGQARNGKQGKGTFDTLY